MCGTDQADRGGSRRGGVQEGAGAEAGGRGEEAAGVGGGCTSQQQLSGSVPETGTGGSAVAGSIVPDVARSRRGPPYRVRHAFTKPACPTPCSLHALIRPACPTS